MSEEGNTNPPRVFVCYARDDRNVVYPEIDWLRQLGFDVHIDRHITPGVMWMEAVAEAIASSQLVLFYASEKSVISDYCAQELRFAMHRNIAVVTVKLSDTQLPPWMELSQALFADADSQQGLARARQLFERALDEQPGQGASLLGLCRTLRMEYSVVNEVELLIEAETRCLQALAVGADPLSTHLALGDVLVTRGVSELARTHYQRASTIAPASAPAWTGLGTVAELSGDDDLARRGRTQ